MGAYSTISITRSKAREYLMGILMRAGDEVLGAMLDSDLDRRLYNVRIVDDADENDDDRL